MLVCVDVVCVLVCVCCVCVDVCVLCVCWCVCVCVCVCMCVCVCETHHGWPVYRTLSAVANCSVLYSVKCLSH